LRRPGMTVDGARFLPSRAPKAKMWGGATPENRHLRAKSFHKLRHLDIRATLVTDTTMLDHIEGLEIVWD
ncbi:MAG: hypothetical protein KDJ51_01800, partial [Nitratireductor sp.]|nr:hypothetical protein [Nitratireductor sp.]